MKKIKNWKLVGALAALALVFAAVKVFRSPRLERSLPSELVEIDTADVTQLVINPAKDRAAEIKLIRAGKKWEISSGKRTGRLEQGGGQSAMRSLKMLRPERMVTRKKEKWNDFQVGDSTGPRVKVITGGDVEADLWIGRVEYTQGRGPGGMSFSGFTYVRLEGEDAVYTVEGFLQPQFNRDFTDWLDKTWSRLKMDSVTRITFRYPADSSFVLEKFGRTWMSGNDVVDSLKVQGYLRGLEYKNLSTIEEATPPGDPQATITFEKASGPLATFEGWPSPEDWIMRSSFQPGTVFSSKGSDALREVWKGKSQFVPRRKK